MRHIVSKSVIVFYLQFFADIKIFVASVIVLIHQSQTTIDRRDFQRFQKMPFGLTKAYDEWSRMMRLEV